jgi:hypothetical protein
MRHPHPLHAPDSPASDAARRESEAIDAEADALDQPDTGTSAPAA